MFSYFELPSIFFDNDLVIRENLKELEIQSLQAPRTITLEPNSPFPSTDLPENHLCVVRDGIAKVLGTDKLFYFLETNDAFLSNSLASIQAHLESEFVSAIDCYPIDDILGACGGDADKLRKLTTVLQCILSQLHILFDTATTQKIDIDPVTRTFKPGEVIIIQNTTPTDVFTLLAGEADVFLGDTSVGEILVGEIFGAMSAASNFDRSASVVARTHCVTLSLPKENFLGLARTHPETLFKLVENMSRIIVSLNEQLAANELS